MKNQLGHYEIIKELGRGGMGVVYLAKDTTLDREVAIKVLSQPISDDDVMVQRFLREAQSAAGLNHPNIVQVFFIGKEGEKHYFVMEYVKGETLTDLIERNAVSEPEQAAQIILQAASGLAAAHDRGIVHRDIKPSNLIIDQNGLVKIADFGIALRQEVGNKLTATGQFLGTPGYLCPEICLGEPSDKRSDIFSLGIVFFEMLSGFSPFEANSPMAMMHKVVTADIPDISTVNAKVSEELKQIVGRMVAKDREARFQDCHELMKALEGYLGIRHSKIGTRPYVAQEKTKKIKAMVMPPAAPPPPVVAPSTPPAVQPAAPVLPARTSSNNSGLLLWATTLVLCILSIGFLSWYYFLREKPSTPEEVLVGSYEVEQTDAEGMSADSVGEGEWSPEGLTEQSDSDAIDTEQASTVDSNQTEPSDLIVASGETIFPDDGAGKGQVKTDITTGQENQGITLRNSVSQAQNTQIESEALSELPDSNVSVDQGSESGDLVQSLKDPFREKPVDLPKQPSVLVCTMGDDLFTEPLATTMKNNYQQAGYRILDEDQVINHRSLLEGAKFPLLALIQIGKKEHADLVVFANVEPISELGIQYGSDYRNQGYRVNTISRIRVQGYFPKEDRPTLNSWTKLTQYNADTAISEAELAANELKENWVPSASNGMDTEKFRVLISSKTDNLVSETYLHYLEKGLHDAGYLSMNLNEYGVSPGTPKMRQLRKRTGARILVVLESTYLSNEEVEAYGQWTELSTFRIKLRFVDLEAPRKNLKNQMKQIRFSAMSMDGDIEVSMEEIMPELLAFMSNL